MIYFTLVTILTVCGFNRIICAKEESYKHLNDWLSKRYAKGARLLDIKVEADEVIKYFDQYKDELKNASAAIEKVKAYHSNVEGNEKQCIDSTYELLLEVDEASGFKARRAKGEPDNMLDKILRVYMENRANNCRESHMSRYMIAKGYLNPETNKRVKSTLDRIVRGRAGSGRAVEMIARLTTFKPITTYEAVGLYYDLFDYRPEFETNFTTDTGKRLAKLMIKRKLSSDCPCQNYLDHLGPNALSPATFDGQFLKTKSFWPLNMDYYESWARFEICRYLVENLDEAIDTMVEGMIKIRE